MVTLPPGRPSAAAQPYRNRAVAESFGDDVDRYDRSRPGYPPGLVDAALGPLAGSPRPRILDVGIGTGLSAHAFRDAGAHVLGVEADERMAARAREHGYEVEVSAFEQSADRGRRFDAVICGQAWHWIDPAPGRPPPRGCCAGAAGSRCSGTPWTRRRRSPPASPRSTAGSTPDCRSRHRRARPGRIADILTTVGEPLRRTGCFTEPEQWTGTRTEVVDRDRWLDRVPTAGGHSRIPADRLRALLDGLGRVVDAHGGSFPMTCTTVLVGATRRC